MIISETAKERRRDTLLALADGTRARIVELLADGPRKATEIHEAFSIAPPAVSRHLRVLREAGLIEEKRPEEDKRVRLYSLKPESMAELSDWIGELSRMWRRGLESFKEHVEGRGIG